MELYGINKSNLLGRKFNQWLRKVEKYLKRHGIFPDEICIVGGAVLEAIGLRKIYGNGGWHLASHLSIAIKGYVRSADKICITNDELIYNTHYYFVYRGFKFARPEVVYYRKKNDIRPKDMRDVKLIEEFLKNMGGRKVVMDKA